MTVSAIDVIIPNSNTNFSFLLPIKSNGNITNVIGSGTPSGIVEQYYLKVITATTCEVYNDPLLTIPVNGLILETEYQQGDYVFLPEPFYFNQSIVKYNNSVWQCIISNNDSEFILGKWELMDSGDRQLNALDRIVGYYQPTVNMPGLDLTQLVSGITYPNGTYLGNAFAPEDQYTLDTILEDKGFSSVEDTVYDIQGDPFPDGYGPEELVPGVVSDNLTMVVTTRPGTDWDATIYGSVGFNVVSTEIIPTSPTQIEFSFSGIVSNPANMSVFDIDYTTNLSTSLTKNFDYFIDWTEKRIFLFAPLAASHGLRVDLYEVGNGNQLIKSNSQSIPLVDNTTTGFVEMPLNCNYSASITNGSGLIRPFTDPRNVIATETDALDNGITCESVDYFSINSSITFEGAVFGNILLSTTYYIKTISYITKKITVSTSISNGIAGPTVNLTTDTGSMLVNIQSRNGLVWTDPIVMHNGTNLVLGEQGIVSQTKSGTNTIVVNSTDNYAIFNTVKFSNEISFGNYTLTAGSFVIGQLYLIETIGTTDFTLVGAVSNTVGVTFTATGAGTGTGTVMGGIIPLELYYITSITNNEFRIASLPGASNVILNDGVGIAYCVTNDYAIAVSDNGITAKLVFSFPFNQNSDYIILSLFGETTPIQYGYTLPETEVFIGDGATAVYTLRNYVGGDNPDNAIVEYNGLRLTNIADYTISSANNRLSLTFAPALGSTLTLTTYNLTDRQYLNTISGGSFTGSVPTIVTISNTTHLPTFDESNYDIDGYSPGPDYLTISSGSTALLNVNDAITFNNPTFGGVNDNQIYYIIEIISSTEFAISTTVNGPYAVLTTDSGSMQGVSNPPTVSNIIDIDNAITLPLAQTTITQTTSGTNLITAGLTLGFAENVPIMFKNNTATGFGNINADGTVYYVKSITAPADGTFTISETLVAGPTGPVAGPEFVLTTDTGLMVAFVGGNETATITTGIPHNLVENDVVRINGVVGSYELNNNTYYAKVVSPTVIGLYFAPYDATLSYVNEPVTKVSTYISNGYVWLDRSFTLETTNAYATTAGSSTDFITVSSNSLLIPGTPVIFTGSVFGGIQSTVVAGSFIIGNTYQIIETGTTFYTDIGSLSNDPGTTFVATGPGLGNGTATAIYYVKEIFGTNQFSVTGARDGTLYPLTTATGAMNVTQWQQADVDRLWVTVNGYRIPSSALYLNPQNNLSILTVIQPGDIVTITNMIPTSTPNETVYIENVNKSNQQSVFRANSLSRTWLVNELKNTDSVIYVEAVSRLTATIVQNETAPIVVDNTMSIGLEGDRNAIVEVVVFNNTRSTTIDPTTYRVVIENVAPILVIDIDPSSPSIFAGNSLTITVTLGKLIYVNGEQISYTVINPILQAGNFKIGCNYVIQTLGDTNFISIGASSNTVGTQFTATGIGSGTGTAQALNAISGLQRGTNGTGERAYIPKYATVYGIVSTNMLPNVYENFTWNSYNFNLVKGDPLQISTTDSANFLNTDAP